MQSTSKAAAIAGALALSGMLGIGSAAFGQAAGEPATEAPGLFPPSSSPYQPAAAASPAGRSAAPAIAPSAGMPAQSDDLLPSTNETEGYSNSRAPRNLASYSRPRAAAVNGASPPVPAPGMPSQNYSPSGAYPVSFTTPAGAATPTASAASYTPAPSAASSLRPGAPFGASAGVMSNNPGYSPNPNAGARAGAEAAAANPNTPGSQYWTSTTPPPPPKKPSRLRRMFSFLDFRNREEEDTETSASSYRDPSTGLNYPVAKPWLQHYNQSSYQPER